MASKIIVDQLESSGSNITIPTGTGLVVTDGIAATNLSGTIADARLPTVPVAKGGTGLTSLGSAGQVVQVNSGGNALEFAAASSGKVKQVVYGNFNVSASTTSTSYQATGVTANITPNHANNLILIWATLGEPDQTDGRLNCHVHKAGSALTYGRLVSEMGRGLSNTGAETHRGSIGHCVTNVAGGTSQITYDLKYKSGTGGTVRFGNGGSSNIILMEIEV
jgi:hypothetical protein